MKGGETNKRMKKKKMLVPALAIIAMCAIMVTSSPAFAQSEQSGYATLVQRLAEKFGLKETDVQTVFDDARKEKQKNNQVRIEERLSQAVKDGKLTETQKRRVLDKHAELMKANDAQREAMKNLTPEERRVAKEKARTELEQWAQDNGIDSQYLFMGMNGRGMHGKGMGMMR